MRRRRFDTACEIWSKGVPAWSPHPDCVHVECKVLGHDRALVRYDDERCRDENCKTWGPCVRFEAVE